MKVSYKWLREYVDFPLSPMEVAAALTSTGLEVDSVSEVPAIRGGLKGLYVGYVQTCEVHPNSDHLHVTTVDLGRGAVQQIVCGAPNVAAGQKVIVADIGCVLYDGDREFTIKKSKLRGVESCGMICAEDEIGIGSSHDGIMVLPDDAVVGTPAAEYFHLESDWVIEVDLTANRADALSHYGVARDLYAWLRQNGYETSLHRPDCSAFAVDNHDLEIAVEIADATACQRYVALSLTDCTVKDSPAWLQERLTAVGLRPINNIVDITNYIMYAYGQPMHCFDADMVTGQKIVVRTMPAGTPFVTLDGVEHTLSDSDLAICNATEAMCIAGVFGGRGSGTYETTRNVVFEAAYFHPTMIRKSARRHGLSTDASYRFERGIDPNGLVYAMQQAAILAKELSGCKVSMDIKDVYPRVIDDAVVELSYDYATRLIGKDIGKDTIRNILESLEMTIVAETTEGITVRVPAYRVDVQRPCDLVEDILRIYGYNNIEIPTVLHSSLTVAEAQDKEHRWQNTISEQLVGAGFHEIVNNSLTKTSYYTSLQAYPIDEIVSIVNPLSADLGVMRGTLLFGGLETIVRNVNRKSPNLALFEFGNCYRYSAERYTAEAPIRAYSESQHLGLWLTGQRVANSWAHTNEKTTVYELKAYVNTILQRIGISREMTVIESSTSDLFSTALIVRSRAGKVIAEYGVVSKVLLKEVGLSQDVFFADLHWDTMMKLISKNVVEAKEISKYPQVSRDLALLINNDVAFHDIETIAYRTEKRLLRSVELFDVYEGDKLPAGKKSYAVNLILQDNDKTLTDKAIDNVLQRITAALKTQLGAELR